MPPRLLANGEGLGGFVLVIAPPFNAVMCIKALITVLLIRIILSGRSGCTDESARGAGRMCFASWDDLRRFVMVCWLVRL